MVLANVILSFFFWPIIVGMSLYGNLYDDEEHVKPVNNANFFPCGKLQNYFAKKPSKCANMLPPEARATLEVAFFCEIIFICRSSLTPNRGQTVSFLQGSRCLVR